VKASLDAARNGGHVDRVGKPVPGWGATPRYRHASERCPAAGGDGVPTRPDHHPDRRMILMHRGRRENATAENRAERRLARALMSRSVMPPFSAGPSAGPTRSQADAMRGGGCLTGQLQRRRRRRRTWRAGPVRSGPGRTSSWFADQRVRRLPGRPGAGHRRPRPR
jgi:hypothetical protein